MKHVIVGALLAALVGTWLVWFGSYLSAQRAQEMQDLIVRACENAGYRADANDCFYSIVIKTGGIRQ